MTNSLYKFGRLCARHGWIVVLIWAIIIASLIVIVSRYGGHIANTFSLPSSNSQLATNLIQTDFPESNNGSAQIVFHSQNSLLTNPQNQASVNEALQKVAKLPNVVEVFSPFAETGASGLSKEQTIGYANINYKVPLTNLSNSDVQDLNKAIQPYNSDSLQIELGGSLLSVYGNSGRDYSEMIGFIAAAIILIIAFGSVIVMGLPLLSSLIGLGIGTMIILIAARFVNIPSVGPAVATMIGIGVGIDYALFIINRHREQLADGIPVEESIARTVATSGQAVLVAGGTVIIANLGLLVVQIPLVSSMAYAIAIAIASAILVSISLLPAVLGLLGKHINSLKVPFLNRDNSKNKSKASIWRKWALHVTNHPWRYIACSLIFLCLLILPVFKLHLGSPNPQASPPNETQTKAYNLISKGFGVGLNDPLLIAVKLNPEQIEQNGAALTQLINTISQNNNVSLVTPPTINANQTGALITVIPKSSQDSSATTELVQKLRSSIIPEALKETSASAYVGGTTATFIDITHQISSRMIKFIALVLVLTFILLMIVFRSLFIPLKAVVMNLLSVLSAFGIIVVIFQWGWGKELIGLEAAGPIVAYVPMMIFAILFGLSMDYEVFILSRVREEYLKTGNNKTAVVEGITHTARVITAAALVMICVFLAFVISDDPVIKMFGVGLAFAVLIDATIIRLVLVPATMDLAGKVNWWLPNWLKKIIPDIHFDDASVFDKKVRKTKSKN